MDSHSRDDFTTGETAHYMGYLVLQTLDNRTFQNITFDAKGFRVV